jgi:hypothetical protein
MDNRHIQNYTKLNIGHYCQILPSFADFAVLMAIVLLVIVFTNTIIAPWRVVVVMKRCSDVTVMGDLACDM